MRGNLKEERMLEAVVWTLGISFMTLLIALVIRFWDIDNRLERLEKHATKQIGKE